MPATNQKGLLSVILLLIIVGLLALVFAANYIGRRQAVPVPIATVAPLMSATSRPTSSPISSASPIVSMDTQCTTDADCTLFGNDLDPTNPCSDACLVTSAPGIFAINSAWLKKQRNGAICQDRYACAWRPGSTNYIARCVNSVCQKVSN